MRRHPGQEPLLEAWGRVWDELLYQWQSENSEDFPGSPWASHDEWMDFYWEDHEPSFDSYTGEAVGLKWSLDKLRDAVSEHVVNKTKPALESVTEAEHPQRFDRDRLRLTWEQVTERVRAHPGVRVPLDLLAAADQDMLWAGVIANWDFGDEDPWSPGFATRMPPWMLTWLNAHPGHWLHDHLDVETWEPRWSDWKRALLEHRRWLTAAYQ